MFEKNQSASSQNLYPVSKIVGNKLIFDDSEQFAMAIKTGAFYLEIPADLDLRPGIKLAHNFYKDLDSDSPGYTGYKHRAFDKSALGYADRPDQVEQLQLELTLWNEFLPTEVCNLLHSMNHLSVVILKNVLEYCGIARDQWDLIMDGALSNNSGHVATINHYRAEKEAIGIIGHKDSGFITLLYANLPGYEFKMNDKWHPMDPKEGYFLVNLGHVFEILTTNLKQPITAPEHRVRQMYSNNDVEDRISFTIFITPRYDGSIYQFDESGSLGIYTDYMSFLKERFSKVKYGSHRVDDKGNPNAVNKLSELYDE